MLRVSGLERSSLLDYPGKISAIIFTHGCNLRCPYCHNPELVIEGFNKDGSFSEKDILSFLESRKGKLDALVITGGEPLVQSNLLPFIKKVKEMGFLIKLDTNGTFPDRLKDFIETGFIDYIAMDVKYPKVEYIKNAMIPGIAKKIEKSIKIIMDSGLDYEFRTTYVKPLHSLESAEGIGQMIKGAKNYYIQNFRPGKTIDPTLTKENSFTTKELEQIKKIIEKYVEDVQIR
ncbi:MAG TPA: anaerobic ribonucleoside-triphosphate reductase activating protein [Candidatus Dojkabacteria bacterium]|nr:anaerobic ribonucleoside-triphosphate reductase activating protein [Candidatus Dojkabacteria bacterium]